MVLPFLKMATCSWGFFPPIICTHHQLVWSDFCFRLGSEVVTPKCCVSKTLSALLGFVMFCRCGGQDSFVLIMCGFLWALFWWLQDCLAQLLSNCFLHRSSFWKVTKGTEWWQGSKIPTLLLPKGNLFMPFTYWISMNFYMNFWKITHLAQRSYLRAENVEAKGSSWLTLRHTIRLRTWANI